MKIMPIHNLLKLRFDVGFLNQVCYTTSFMKIVFLIACNSFALDVFWQCNGHIIRDEAFTATRSPFYIDRNLNKI